MYRNNYIKKIQQFHLHCYSIVLITILKKISFHLYNRSSTTSLTILILFFNTEYNKEKLENKELKHYPR